MHRWIRSTTAVAALGTMGLLTACGDDADDPAGPGNTGDELTAVESQALVEVIMGGALFGFGNFAVAGAGDLQAGSPPYSESFNETAQCDMGGTVKFSGTVSGNVDDNTGYGTMNLDADLVHSSCQGAASTGQVFTLSGAPKVSMDFDMTSSSSGFSWNGSMGGNVSWSTSGKQGTCAISMNFNMTGDYTGENYSGSQSGKVCGTDVNQTF